MIKKDGLAKPTKASLQEAFKCGECLHFKQTCHSTHDDVCSKLGVRHFALAPPCFTPDYTRVITNIDEFTMLAALFGTKTSQQKRILLAMLRQQPHGKKLPMGTCMYLNSRGREYIGNYLVGYVVGYTSAGQIVLAGSPDRNTRGRTFFAYLKSDDSLLTRTEWRQRFLDLRKMGRIIDPKDTYIRDITASVKEDNYEVPTIDSAPTGGAVKKINKRTAPLTQILTF